MKRIIFLFLGFYIGNHRVKTYDYKSRTLLTTIGMKGTGNGQVRIDSTQYVMGQFVKTKTTTA